MTRLSPFRVLLAGLMAAALLPHAAAVDTVIRDVTVFDGQAFHPHQSVLIRQGRIEFPYRRPTPAGAVEVSCQPCTLLPGLIDSHVHAYQQFDLPLHFGVTTQLDMFTSWPAIRALRQQMKAGTNHEAADVFTAGTLVTAPGGHGTEYGFEIPTLSRPQDAAAFVDARIQEGSDFIKIVLDDGHAFHRPFATLDDPTLAAVIRAAHARRKLAVVHVSDLASAKRALKAGADGLVHWVLDEEADDEFVAPARRRHAFVIPTWTVYEGMRGGQGGEALANDPAVAPLISDAQAVTLGTRLSPQDQSGALNERFRRSVVRLAQAGIPLLAGTDAGNPGTLHGASLHRELALLSGAGLTPGQVLASATSVPARVFGLRDRGRVATGMKADLVLVRGDLREDISATRHIVSVWKDGQSRDAARADRIGQVAQAKAAAARMKQSLGEQMVRFRQVDGQVSAESPQGSWGLTSDQMMKGHSQVSWHVPEAPGAAAGATDPIQGGDLEVSGELKPGAPMTWAGLAHYPAPSPFQPRDLSPAKGLRVTLRTHGDTVMAQFFSRLGSFTPEMQPLKTGEEWQTFDLPFSSLPGFSPSEATALLFVVSGKPRTFRFEIRAIEWLR
ncbi:MAG: amidohydrolase [Burkholderiaceae bacterium]|nr:MAG: amidohydrolase [Burkholderiaceae bacterium]